MKWKPDWSDIADNLLIGLMVVAATAIFIVFCVCTWKAVTTERTINARRKSIIRLHDQRHKPDTI